MLAQPIRVDGDTRPQSAGQRSRCSAAAPSVSPSCSALAEWRGTRSGVGSTWSSPPTPVFRCTIRTASIPTAAQLRSRRPSAVATERPQSSEVIAALGDSGIRIVIDATADGEVAANHPALLDAGIHVATACKLAGGTSLSLWREIQAACERRGSGFGDRATVGAGPAAASVACANFRHGGDRIHAIAGVMSGSLAWLFDRFDGSRPFSALVREAHAKGYTEPDPREDLVGRGCPAQDPDPCEDRRISD